MSQNAPKVVSNPKLRNATLFFNVFAFAGK